MATDLERLVVSMSADFKSFENAMAKASGVTRAQLKVLKADAANAGGAAEVAFDGASRGVKRFGSSAAVAAKQAGALRAQTGNLSAQFQDIAVQLQGGANPFTIALQQGTQISAVLGGAGAGGAVKALGGAFLGLLSPVSLATIAIIGLGGVAINYFTSLLSDADNSAEALKEQADLIKRVADQWGDVVPAVRDYQAALESATRQAELLQAASAIEGQIKGDFADQFRDLNEQFKGAISLVPDVNREFGILATKVETGSVSADDFTRISELLADVLAQHASPELAAFASAFNAVASSAAASAAQIAVVRSEAAAAASEFQRIRAAEAASIANYQAATKATAEFVAEQERRNALSEEALDLENEAARLRSDAGRAGGILPEAEANRLATETLAAETRRAEVAKASAAAARAAERTPRSGGGGGSRRSAAASEADREREAVIKLIEALQFEQSLIGATDVEREKANALRRAGAAATDEQRAQIEQIVEATYMQRDALEQSAEAMDRLQDISKDVLGGIFDDLRDGANAADVLSNALNRVAESMVTAGIDRLIEGAFSGGFGGGRGGLLGGRIIPGILHSGGIAGSDGYGHGRSVSPAVFHGAPRYHGGGVAGLMPGEVPAILQRGERVLPRGQSGGGRIEVVLSPDLEARIREGANSDAVKIVHRARPKIVRDSVKAVGGLNRETGGYLGR